MAVEKTCLTCNETFEVDIPARAKKRKYCSQKCAKPPKIEMVCLFCKKIILIPPSKAKKQKYCSRACAHADPNGSLRVRSDLNLSKPRIHRITNVDENLKTGICSKCGPVPVRRRSDTGAWRCKKAELSNTRKNKYGVSDELIDKMLEIQQNTCAICKQSLHKSHLDHDHITGTPRGLLCSHCNTGLGLFGDKIENLRQAIEYLQKPTCSMIV